MTEITRDEKDWVKTLDGGKNRRNDGKEIFRDGIEQTFYLSLGSMNTEWFYNFFNYVRVEMNLPPKKTQNLRVKLKS